LEKKILPPAIRAEFAGRFAAAGLDALQIGAFVNPKLVPQTAGTDEVWRLIPKQPNVRYSALVLSEKGLARAAACGIPHVDVYVSASETHSARNVGMSVSQAMDAAVRIVRAACEREIGVTFGVMCAFGCRFEGAVPVERVAELLSRAPLECTVECALADTTGMARPDQVEDVVRDARRVVGAVPLSLHLHDTEGRGYENLLAGLEAGVRRFDASAGGLGGCPFIPGAAGNISTERAVAVVRDAGYSTGVDEEALREITRDLLIALAG
jgi:hydroxymethylglutaryl-CoA lyase